MKGKTVIWAAAAIAVLALSLSSGTLAQVPTQDHLSGILNDYTAATNSSAAVIGPWEIRGKWTITIHQHQGTADFSAFVTMEFSDYWLANSASAKLTDPSSRNQHTHTITLTGATISTDLTGCPVFNPPTTGGFVISGPAHVTGNGDTAPFEKKSGPSQLTICVTGGPVVPYSNITLQFASGSPAAGHFGTSAINGAVRQPKASDGDH